MSAYHHWTWKSFYPREEITTTSNMVMDEWVWDLFRSKLFQWIRPQDITHESAGRRFPEAVDLRHIRLQLEYHASQRKQRYHQLTIRKSSNVFNSGLNPP